MKTILRTTIAIATLIFSFNSSSQQLTGAHLHNMCKEDEISCEMLAIGLINGIVDANLLAQSMLKLTNDVTPFFCIPNGVNSSQAFEVIKKYIKDNPEKWHDPLTFNAVAALHNAFPCSK